MRKNSLKNYLAIQTRKNGAMILKKVVSVPRFIVNTLSKELGKRDWNLVMDLYVDMDIFSDVPEHEAHALIDQSPYPINLKNMLHELFIFYSEQKKKITGEKDLAQYLSYMFDAY
jgi:hypothetical protein